MVSAQIMSVIICIVTIFIIYYGLDTNVTIVNQIWSILMVLMSIAVKTISNNVKMYTTLVEINYYIVK